MSKAGETGTDPQRSCAAATSDSMSSAHHSWRKIYEGVDAFLLGDFARRLPRRGAAHYETNSNYAYATDTGYPL